MTERTQKLEKLYEAINGLEGVEIPYNIIKHCLIPLNEWLEKELKK